LAKSARTANFFSRETKNGTKLKCLEYLSWAWGTSKTVCGTTLCKSELVSHYTSNKLTHICLDRKKVSSEMCISH